MEDERSEVRGYRTEGEEGKVTEKQVRANDKKHKAFTISVTKNKNKSFVLTLLMYETFASMH